MAHQYSIASARDQLAKIVHDAERGRPVELTRRGKPVAMLLSVAEYRRLLGQRGSFMEALALLRTEEDFENLGLEPEEWVPVRDPSPGRPVDL